MKTLRMISGLLGCIALALAVGRCSPLASSISKATQKVAEEKREIHAFPFNTKVVDEQEFEEALHSEPTEAVQLELTQAQLEEFQKNGQVEVKLDPNTVPERAKGIFKVKLSSDDIWNYGLNKFEAILVHQGEDKWLLKVDPSVSSGVSSNVRNELSTIVISVAAKEIKTEPAPTGSF